MEGTDMQIFWQKWLLCWAGFVTVFGLVLAGGAFAATDGLTQMLFSLFGNPLPADMDHHHRFAIGLMGAVTMGWGLTYWGAFKALFALEPATAAPIWRWMLVASLIWYVVDSTISIATGIWMNAVSNTIVIMLLMIPLVKSGALSGQEGPRAKSQAVRA
jgi:hypothetical protein